MLVKRVGKTTMWSIMKECTILPMKHESLKQASKLRFCRRKYYVETCDCIGKCLSWHKTDQMQENTLCKWSLKEDLIFANCAPFCLKILDSFGLPLLQCKCPIAMQYNALSRNVSSGAFKIRHLSYCAYPVAL